MKIKVIMVLAICILSCKTNKNNAKMANVEPVLIAKGNLYGSGSEGITKQNMVIENQSDWQNLMDQMNKANTVSDSFSETKIDFSSYNIIAVFNDVKGSGGNSIELDISTTSENTLVKVNYFSPKGNATSVMTQPYYIVKVAKRNVPIVFE